MDQHGYFFSFHIFNYVKAVISDGSYDIPNGLVFSFPVEIKGGNWRIVQGLNWSENAKKRIKTTTDELISERDEVLKILNH